MIKMAQQRVLLIDREYLGQCRKYRKSGRIRCEKRFRKSSAKVSRLGVVRSMFARCQEREEFREGVKVFFGVLSQGHENGIKLETGGG